LGSFPKKQILRREQAKFIIYCLTYDRIIRQANGYKTRTHGLAARLAERFGVTVACIHEIAKRRIWRSINRPKPKWFFRDPKCKMRMDRQPPRRQSAARPITSARSSCRLDSAFV
jgi:hypothetical protein